MSNSHIHTKAYKVSIISLAILIAVFNVYGAILLIPAYGILAISFYRAELEISSQSKKRWIVAPLLISFLVSALLMFLFY